MPKFTELKAEILSCQKCSELIKSRTQVVFGCGNEKSEILLIGEAPGANEDKQGIPFCGMSGKILNELLTSANLQREDIFITNTLLCRPPNNRNPAKEEIENCRERLNKLIETMRPKVMVTIGNFATERILGKTGIKSMHGKVHSFIFNGQEIKVVPVIHPASYLYSGRNPQMLAEMKADFKVISSLVKTKQQQKQLGEF
ncbi:MAG: uracil-DNA glycosylase [Nanoarchaeota archaeon]